MHWLQLLSVLFLTPFWTYKNCHVTQITSLVLLFLLNIDDAIIHYLGFQKTTCINPKVTSININYSLYYEYLQNTNSIYSYPFMLSLLSTNFTSLYSNLNYAKFKSHILCLLNIYLWPKTWLRVHKNTYTFDISLSNNFNLTVVGLLNRMWIIKIAEFIMVTFIYLRLKAYINIF